MARHKHADLIIAWANGAIIQFKNRVTEEWEWINTPSWEEEREYRIKPKAKIKVYRFAFDTVHQGPSVSIHYYADEQALRSNFGGVPVKNVTRLDWTMQEREVE